MTTTPMTGPTSTPPTPIAEAASTPEAAEALVAKFNTPPALPDDIKALLADTPKVTPEMRARLEQAAKDAAAPTLPPEVREAIDAATRKINWRLNTTHYVNIAGIIRDELAPLWPRPAGRG